MHPGEPTQPKVIAGSSCYQRARVASCVNGREAKPWLPRESNKPSNKCKVGSGLFELAAGRLIALVASTACLALKF